jgi:putative ABC transport system permease protein
VPDDARGPVMKFVSLVVKSARRSKRRTALTVLSVAIAVFLFAALRAVLDGFQAATQASSSTRIVTIRSTSLIFQMPTSHAEAIKTVPGVRDLTWANWFGGIYKDPKNFFPNIAIEPESYLRIYPEVILSPEDRRAFLDDRTGCIVGDGLAKRFGWKLGDRITLQVGIPTYGSLDYPFTVRGVYRSGGAAVDNQTMMFHWKYADERSLEKGQVGWFIEQIANPDQEARISSAIDQKFANSPYETKTDTEKAFQSSFVSMFGNLNVLLGSIALAVVITTLFVAANTMAMSVRERTTEIAVMRTLGFQQWTIFALVAGEGLMMAIVGGVIGAGLARVLVTGSNLGAGGFIPDFGVSAANVAAGIALGAFIGLVAGIIPATMAARLKIVDALRRVA